MALLHCLVLPLARFPGMGSLDLTQSDQSQMAGTGGPYRGWCLGGFGSIENLSLLWSRGRASVCVPSTLVAELCPRLPASSLPLPLASKRSPYAGALLVSALDVVHTSELKARQYQ